jgi:sugar lactone lactonase YvrE
MIGVVAMRGFSRRLRLKRKREDILMNTHHFFERVLVAVWALVLAATPSIAHESNVIVVSGFQTPESVVHDGKADVYLVSNVGSGNPAALDHNGFISIVSPEGVIQQLKWIHDGVNGVTLNSPKGMWLRHDALYVADVDTLRIFDRVSGVPLDTVPIPNPFAPSPLFLNDVIVAGNGTAYITDNRNNAIFTVDRNGYPSLLVSGAQLGGPNGVRLDDGHVSWVTFFGHEVRRLTSTGTVVTEAALPAVDVSSIGLPPGALLLDGYYRHRGSVFVTSWVTGSVYRIGRSRTKLEIVAKFVSLLENPAAPAGPADISVDKKRNRLLVPLFNANQLIIIRIRDASEK